MSNNSQNEERLSQAVKEILAGGFTRTLLSVILGFLVGALFMIGSNKEFLEGLGYFFSRPTDSLGAAWTVVSEGYGALFRGAIFNAEAETFEKAIRPLTETLRLGAPLVAAGLGIGLTFRVGLFNIGGTGQLIFGMIFATWVATRIELPFVIHTLVALVAGILGAALLGALVGFLKARTGAHEVILTIMLNYIALYFFTFLMRDPALLQEERATGNPKADPAAETAQFPALFGDQFSLHWGLIISLAAVILYWWLMERSTIGYRLRMVGYNPDAAKTAGINVNRTYVLAMGLSAAFVGVAAANQALGSAIGVTPSTHANIGFDAITVALLGGSSAPGILLAGMLFGAFKAGAPAMQVIGISPEVLGIVQGAIVLFIAAPPLIRAIFGLPKPQNTNALGAIRDRIFAKGGAK
ncbi:ABC transporter permease [Aquiluna borgnonia]|uniref:ABC transporter permease n=1 Tax=Aquiluna borgnonia TaxID=2499157 RepID=A0A7D4UL99_9MICO|nr:ABC transporter permease [Aquiluna borgnonia]QKJ24858.1 ABC transporter permease [Aquiluna borgnonia]